MQVPLSSEPIAPASPQRAIEEVVENMNPQKFCNLNNIKKKVFCKLIIESMNFF